MKGICRIFLLLLPYLAAWGCGPHRLAPDEVERNRMFSEIVKREDSRTLGEDGFFPEHLEHDSRPEVQRWCAVALGRIGNPRALPWLYQAFRARYGSVRAAAAFAVGEIEDRASVAIDSRQPDLRAVAALETLLDDGGIAVRMRAVEALGKIGGKAQAAEIVRRLPSFLLDDSPAGRTALGLAITALMRLKAPGSFPALEELCTIDDPEVQWRALNALDRLGDDQALPLYRGLLDSPNPEVRTYAARGLGICGKHAPADRLLPLLEPKEADGRTNPLPVRVSALEALGKLKYEPALPAIRTALAAPAGGESDADRTNFAIAAAAAVGGIGAPEGTALLQPLLDRPGPVADAAAIALARLLKDDPERFFALVPAVRSQDPVARRARARALGELGGERAVRELKQMLAENPLPRGTLVVPALLEALARAKAPDLEEILGRFLQSTDGVTLRAALSAYAPPPSVRAPWTPLLGAFRGIAAGGDVEAETAVLERLRPWIREKDVQSLLRAALEDRLRNVRITAAGLLREAGVAVPPEERPAETRATDFLYDMAAAARRDRTIAVLETDRGDIEIELYREDAPLTVANFVSLARAGFFSGLTFMRVVPFFVIQGGDPRNDQEGGPGYTIRCEINMRPFERGSVGMALAGKDTGGSQFFVTLAPQPHLDGGYTCFGRVVSGMTAVDRMTPGDRIHHVRIVEEVTAIDYRRY